MGVQLPEVGYVRLPVILSMFPISRSAWWQGIREGRFPQGLKLGPRTTVWRASDIRQLLADVETKARNGTKPKAA